jgi:hypothetical protein
MRSPKAWRGYAAIVAVVAAVLLMAGLEAAAAASGPARLHVAESSAAAERCPPHSTGEVTSARWPQAREPLFPVGAVSVRICRYNGDIVGAGAPNPARAKGVLLGQAVITNANAIKNLSRRFNRLGRDRGVHSCPDADIAFLAFAAHPGGHRLAIGIDSCLLVSNGASGSYWVYATPLAFPLIASLVQVTGGNPTPWQRH